MKNKKLFAILTLVCFMFTLMPVAAFAAPTEYAEVDSDSEIVAVSDDIRINVTNATSTSYIVFAMEDGVVDKTLRFANADLDNDKDGDFLTIAKNTLDAGTYEVYVVDYNNYTNNVLARYNNGEIDKEAAAKALIAEATVVMLDKEVVVKPSKSTYAITLSGDNVVNDTVSVKANAGYTTEEVVATLVNTADNNEPVVGATVTISTNSDAVTLNKTEVKTNAAGQAKFKVSASTAGEFKVYVEYGTKADATLTVDAGTLAPAKITTIYEPTAPVALDSAMSAPEVTFSIYDANGNAIKGDNSQNGQDIEDITGYDYKITVTEKPAGSSLAADDAHVDIDVYNWNGSWCLGGDATFDEEGTYSFKVTLENGNYATAKVEVKEFQTPVDLKLTYKQEAVELDGEAILDKVLFVDANGVTKKAKIGTDVELSANGYAIEQFNATNGTVKVEADEKYVGSTITVLAVAEKYNLTASVELTVANEAAGVEYASNTADVAVNNNIKANIVDADGNKVALGSNMTTAATIQYIVLDKPANAKVAVTTAQDHNLVTKGEFTVSFTASEIGTYKVQTVVRYEQAAGVVKYYSGIEEITVGNTGFEDVVVMSIGSSTIVVNADAKAIDAAPMIENGRTFVPFRALAEAFGATVAYDEATQAITAELDGITVVMTVGSATYTVNGVEATADVAPFIVDGRTMVPVRFVAEAFGITVTPTYDENGATADVIFAK